MSIKILSPVAAPTSPVVHGTPPPASLPDRVLGVLINGKEYSDIVLRRLVERLTELHQVRDVVWWDKGFPAKPAPFLEEIASRSSLVLNGVGH